MGSTGLQAQGGKVVNQQIDLGQLLELEIGLKAPRWHERARAAQVLASILVENDRVRELSSNESCDAGPSQFADICDRVLQELLHGMTLKDSHWQVREAAVESAGTILSAARTEIPAETFKGFVWVLLAACQDSQPEVQSAACNCILKRLLSPICHNRHVIIMELCERFIEAAMASELLPLNSDKTSSKPMLVGLDNFPDGEILLHGMITVIGMQLVPLPNPNERPNQELQRIPLLVVVVAIALQDAERRQSRLIAMGFSKLLRLPYFIAGSSLLRSYQKAGIIDDDLSSILKAAGTVTLLNGMALAFDSSRGDECPSVILSTEELSPPQPSEVSGLSSEELIAVEQILEMLQVPDELTRALNDQDGGSKIVEYTGSTMPLLRILTSIIKNWDWQQQNQQLPEKLVDDIIFCCATFSTIGWEYGGAPGWTSRRHHGLSRDLLTCLSDAVHIWSSKIVPETRLKDAESTKISSLISGRISSLYPKIKQVIQDSDGRYGRHGEVLNRPEGSLASSIIVSYQMQSIVRLVERPILGPHGPLVVPCVLTALDHFSPEVKRQGMGSCIHLAQNMDSRELKWCKDVILDAVTRCLVGCGDLWPVAVKMAVTTVTKIERNPRTSWYGTIFSEMLGELERQRDDKVRRIVWLNEIPVYIESMGLVLVANFKRLLPLLFRWLHAPDDITCHKTLAVLQSVITCTWPRIPTYVNRIWKELIHTYQESVDRKLSSEIKAAVFEVCRLLQLCAGPTFEEVWQKHVENISINELVIYLQNMKSQNVSQV